MNIVAHNMLAMNASRQYQINTKSKAKSTEKLSSGYKINRASDDAAGLSISEKMRRQIRGLNQGTENTQDGVSLCQVADGALAEVNNMLHRITELSVQSANGTNADSDRQAIQNEISQILSEIDRIGDTTEFNTVPLFKGGTTNGAQSPGGHGTTMEVNRNYNVSGMPIDNSVSHYTVLANLTDGVSVNGEKIGWNSIVDTRGNSLADEPLQQGTYKIPANGMELSFEVNEKDSKESLVNALNKLEFDVSHIPAKTNMVSSMSFKLFTPNETPAFSKTEFQGFINETSHKIIADSDGVKIDSYGTKINWDDLFKNVGTTQDEGLKNGGTITIGNLGKYEIDINFKSGSSISDLVNEINGVNFNVSGTMESNPTIICPNPCGTSITATCTRFELADDLYKALGYNILDGSSTVKAGYNGWARNDGNGYDYGLVMIEFEKNSDSMTRPFNTYLKTSSDSTKALQELFKDGTTKTSGSITLDFVRPSSDYGESNVSIKWDYPAGISISDLWGPIQTSTPTVPPPLYGADALEMGIKNTYSANNLVVNNVDTPESTSVAIDSSKVKNTITIPSADVPDTPVLDDILSLWIQAGAEAGSGMFLEIDKMNTAILEINGLDVSIEAGANDALDKVPKALAKLMESRSKIGAQQNRLEHTIANNENAAENTTDAESRIRDTDMAEEMVKFSKDNILSMVGESMLAQANQSNQGILSLLQ